MTPILGDLINSTVGNTVNRVVGGLVDKYLPKSMSEAEKADIKLKMQQFVADEVKADASIVQAVNATMQAEAKSDKWYVSGWRPYWGFISGTVYGVVGLVLSAAIIKLAWSNPDKLFTQLPMIIGAFATYFSIAGAVLGITAWHRGKKQRVQAGEVPPVSSNMLAGVLDKLKDKI